MSKMASSLCSNFFHLFLTVWVVWKVTLAMKRYFLSSLTFTSQQIKKMPKSERHKKMQSAPRILDNCLFSYKLFTKSAHAIHTLGCKMFSQSEKQLENKKLWPFNMRMKQKKKKMFFFSKWPPKESLFFKIANSRKKFHKIFLDWSLR